MSNQLDVIEEMGGGCGSGGCGCGATAEELPVLDGRSIPHAVRHAAILGALDGLGQGAGLVLIAPHDPLPLLATVEQRYPDGFEVDYLQRGPDAWHVRFRRR